MEPQSFAQTSDNVIVEALRRDGAEIELRLVESLGLPGTAEVTLNLPHASAAQTDLTGGRSRKLEGGPPTIPHSRAADRDAAFWHGRSRAGIQPLTKWDELVPAPKLPALRKYLPDAIGQPPDGP